jgi:hypothetical protein
MDADKLVRLSLALFASGGHVEDRFWEAKISALLSKQLRSGHQTLLEAALDHLQKNHPEAHGALMDLIEAHCESFLIQRGEKAWQAVLIAAPILAWTRYSIPLGALKQNIAEIFRSHLQAHIFAEGVELAMAPYLYSIDQLPENHVDVYRVAQQLAQSACSGQPFKLDQDDTSGTSPILADARFLLAVALVPSQGAVFRWQDEESDTYLDQATCLKRWKDDISPTVGLILPGCEWSCELPNAYHAACRSADENIRPHVLRTAVRHLEDVLGIPPENLRAVIAGFGEQDIREYRIGFTQRGSSEVLYGIVWTLFEHSISSDEEESNIQTPLENIVELLKKLGITDIRRHLECFEPEYCDDCGAPLYADPLGEIVHPEMPEDANPGQPQFH